MIASEYGKAIVSDAAYPGVAEFAQVEIIVHFGLASFVAALLHPATEQELGLEPSGKGDVVGCPELQVKGQRQVFRFRSEEHTSELQSLMRISYAVFCLKKKNTILP